MNEGHPFQAEFLERRSKAGKLCPRQIKWSHFILAKEVTRPFLSNQAWKICNRICCRQEKLLFLSPKWHLFYSSSTRSGSSLAKFSFASGQNFKGKISFVCVFYHQMETSPFVPFQCHLYWLKCPWKWAPSTTSIIEKGWHIWHFAITFWLPSGEYPRVHLKVNSFSIIFLWSRGRVAFSFIWVGRKGAQALRRKRKWRLSYIFFCIKEHIRKGKKLFLSGKKGQSAQKQMVKKGEGGKGKRKYAAVQTCPLERDIGRHLLHFVCEL